MKINRRPTIDVRYEGDVLVLTLDRPEVLNALNGELLADLVSIFGQARHDESRVVVLTGAGRGFCSGGDHGFLAERFDDGANGAAEGIRPAISDMIPSLLALDKPVLAAVNGPAVGIGATLALYCDYIAIADEARIGDTHVAIGLAAGADAAIWVALLGPLKAREMLMTSRLVSGTEAAAMGLVNRSLPGAELLPHVMELAQHLAGLPPFALRATKAAVNRQVQSLTDLITPVAYAWEQLSMLTPEHRAAVEGRAAGRRGPA
jgi:enoyl-CoA hydratase